MAEVKEFILPDLGEGLVEATIVEWKVAVGDEVSLDQIVVEVESAKSVVDLPTPYAGRVVALGAAEGEVMHAGQVLLTVEPVGAAAGDSAEAAQDVPVASTSSETESAADQSVESEHPASEHAEAGSGAVLVGYGTQESTARLRRPEGGRFKSRRKQLSCKTEAAGAATHAARGGNVPSAAAIALIDEQRNSPVMSPLVRREAQAAGFDARHLQGSGHAGLVLRADVQQAAAALSAGRTSTGAPQDWEAAGRGVGQAQATATGGVAPVTQIRSQPSPQSTHPAAQARPTSQPGEDRRIPVDGMRAIVAEHMAESHASVPKATIWLDADVTPLLDLRRQLQDSTGERFSLTTLIARIVIAGLKQHPRLNSSFDKDANEIVEHGRINLGIAAQTPRGLAVPVLHGVGEMNLRELRDGIGELVAEAPRGKYSPSQLQGGTFTVNNYGGFGVDGSSPIINLPQAAMLGIGRLKERPWVVNGELAVRTVMTVSFVFDHRVCDGDAASAFLTFVTDRMEKPALLFADL